MTVSLTPTDAQTKLQQIEQARQTAVAKLTNVQDAQESMLSSGWQGGSATKYGSTSAQQHEDFAQIITYLNHIVDTGSAHIRSIASMDNG